MAVNYKIIRCLSKAGIWIRNEKLIYAVKNRIRWHVMIYGAIIRELLRKASLSDFRQKPTIFSNGINIVLKSVKFENIFEKKKGGKRRLQLASNHLFHSSSRFLILQEDSLFSKKILDFLFSMKNLYSRRRILIVYSWRIRKILQEEVEKDSWFLILKESCREELADSFRTEDR